MKDTCTTCGNWMMFPKSHRCPPAFQVLCADEKWDDDEWAWASTYYAHDAEAAAEKFAEDYDSNGDYTCVSGNDLTVDVRNAEGVVTRWTVHGESVPSYSAYPTA